MLFNTVSLVKHGGFEPPTTWLKVRCSTDWASAPHIYYFNWASWIRTNECSSQSAVPYRLAIAHYSCPPAYGTSSIGVTPGWIQGFEPWASRATIWRANQLRYTHHMRYAVFPISPMCSKGFEPPTHGLEGRCSIQLSYEHIKCAIHILKAGDGNRTHVSSLEG